MDVSYSAVILRQVIHDQVVRHSQVDQKWQRSAVRLSKSSLTLGQNTGRHKGAETLNNEFNKILNNHAPIKEIKPKKNHCPALQQNTKQDIKCRNSLRTMMNKYGNEEVKEQHKALVKYVKENIF